MTWNPFRSSLVGQRAPDITGETWFNFEHLPPAAAERVRAKQPLRLETDLAGKIVLIDFWDYSCINCLRTLPYLREWWERYRQHGFLIIGVHTPEFEFAKDAENVRNAVLRFSLGYPVVSDPEYATWRRYDNNVWPRELLVDAQGIIQHDHRGEGKYQEKESKIQELITAVHPGLTFSEPMPPVRETDAPGAVCYPTTPEIYLGFSRGQSANQAALQQGTVTEYRLPDRILINQWALAGDWLVQAEEVVHARATAAPEDSVVLHYQATEVFTVARSLNQSEVLVEVWQDEQPLSQENKGEDVEMIDGKSIVRVREDRLYELVKNPEHGQHMLRLVTASDQLAVHTLTFGTSCA